MHTSDSFRCCHKGGLFKRHMLTQEMKMWIIEMIRRVPKSIYFQLSKEILRNFLQEPIDDHSSFDSTLGMQDENYFGKIRVVKSIFDDAVAGPDVGCCVVEVSLNEALND